MISTSLSSSVVTNINSRRVMKTALTNVVSKLTCYPTCRNPWGICRRKTRTIEKGTSSEETREKVGNADWLLFPSKPREECVCVCMCVRPKLLFSLTIGSVFNPCIGCGSQSLFLSLPIERQLGQVARLTGCSLFATDANEVINWLFRQTKI